MRKGLIVTGVLLVLFFAAVYLFIPSRLIVSEFGSATCSFPAAKRFVFNKGNWTHWQKTKSVDGEDLTSDIGNTFYNSLDILIRNTGEQYEASMILIPLGIDSTGFQFTDTIESSANPIVRINQYTRARTLKKYMGSMLRELIAFLNDKEKIYSIKIEKEQVTDIPLLSRHVVMQRPPTANDAYELINSVRAFAAAQGDPANGIAMKYSSQIDSTHYELQVAIPTTRLLKGNNDFQVKGLVGGNPIFTVIRGGEATISNAWKSLEQFKADYKLASPAIPYELMITDRTKQADTTKWVTKIVIPTRL
jgi:effector-binding domain-containing protein